MPQFSINIRLFTARSVIKMMFLFTLATLSVLGQSKIQSDVRSLKTGQTIERNLKEGEAHSYFISLKAKHFLNVIVEQKSTDVRVSIFDAAGNKLAEVNNQNDLQGGEPFLFIAENAGKYRLEVSSTGKTAAGLYELKIKELRTSTEKDKNRVAAQRVFSEGRLLGSQGTKETRQKAIEKFEQALEFYRLGGDINGEIKALNNVGLNYYYLGEWQKALEYFTKALPLSKNAQDKRQEANTLGNIGNAYLDLGDTQQAIDYFNQSIKLHKALGNKVSEADILGYFAYIYADKGEIQKALNNYNEALRIYKEVGDKNREIETLVNIGAIYAESSEFQKAIEYSEQTLSHFVAIGNKRAEAKTLGNIGDAYNSLGQWQKALESFTKALSLQEITGNKSDEANTLNKIGKLYFNLEENQKAIEYFTKAFRLSKLPSALSNIGDVYSKLGEQNKALSYYMQALPLLSSAENKLGQSRTLGSIGASYFKLGEKQKALEYYNRALQFSREAEDKIGVAAMLAGIGSVYFDLGDNRKALEHFDQAVQIQRTIGHKKGETGTLNNFGKVYEKLGENQKAIDFYTQALLLARTIGSKAEEAKSLDGLRNLWLSNGNSRLAIFYGKQSVNKYQEMRQAVGGLEKETQQTYLETIRSSYQQLADILISEGRFAEAQQVLLLLKQEEYFEFVRRDADEIKSLKQRVSLKTDEQKLIERYNQLADKVTAIGVEFQKLQEKKNKLSQGAFLPAEEQKQYETLSANLKDANAVFRLFLEKELAEELGKSKKEEIKADRALQEALRSWGEGTVALSTIAGEKYYRVFLTTPTVQVDGKTEISRVNLNKKIFAFREALQNPSIDPRPLGKEIYDIIVKPIEKHLEAANAKTLVWSLDGALRYIPLAALSPDGKTYLIEKYQTALITFATRSSIKTENEKEWRALGLGVSDAQTVDDPVLTGEKINFDALPGVKTELTTIVKDEQTSDERGLLSGKRLIDADFTAVNFGDLLTRKLPDGKGKYTIVHIASHFRSGTDTKNSFLLLGGGKTLTLEQISDSPQMNFGGIELVTLSACSTAFGSENSSGEEVDSLAAFIENRGAKAVIATLWSVADWSTQLLMSKFYSLKKENPQMTKAEAIQMAQTAMIKGKLKSSAKESGCRSGVVKLNGEKQNEYKCDRNSPYSHPYYWSPFILIGNWR